jgi:hypothetical protein
VMMADGSRGASNAKAKRELGWTLRYPSWRQGFPVAYGSAGQGHSRADRPQGDDGSTPLGRSKR